MSYILDAIKKAERQRQKDQIPTLESLASVQYDKSNGFPMGRLVLIGIAVIVLVAIIWFRQPILAATKINAASFISFASNVYSKLSSDSPELSVDTSNQPATQQPATQQPAQEIAESAVETEVSKLSESQINILRSISFTVVSYSKDANKRFVMDGSTVLHEGDDIKGFTIAAIEKDSVVLQLEGQNFRIKL